MTYTEWRDELKSNLLCVTESERRRVLDYYAEAYADRREAGFTEREIIDEFGAPYDAAQRILSENGEDYEKPQRPPRKPDGEDRRKANTNTANNTPPPPPPPPPYQGNAAAAVPAGENYTWLFVLLCIIFCVPLFMLIMGMVGITVGFCTAPIIVIGTGAAIAGSSFGTMIGGDLYYGLYLLGSGIITFGVGVILCPICFKLVKLMWQLFKKLFSWLKSLFSGNARRA